MKASKTRPGVTEKFSVSLPREELAALKKRAKKLYGGNVSAVVSEFAHRAKEEEGREALVEWLGAAAVLTPADRDAIDAEWLGESARPKRRRAS